MAIHISSNDVSTGTSYNGTFDIADTLIGTYGVDLQSVDTGNIPWMWNACKSLRIRSYDGLDTMEVTINFDYASIGTSTNTTTIANSLEASINDVMSILPGAYARTVSVVYTAAASGNYYTLTFDGQVTLVYSWSGSTAKYVFDKTNDETDTEFSFFSTFMTTSPKFIECYIDESQTEYNTSRGTYPTLLWATSDVEVTGQEIEFLTRTDILTISLYRTNVQIDPVPLSNSWDLIFSLI